MKPHVSKPTQPTNVITLQRKKERKVVGYDMTSLKSGKHGWERLLQNEFKCLSFFPVLLVGNGWPFLKKGPSQGFCASTSNVFLLQQVPVPFNIRLQWQKHDILRDLYFMLVNEMRKGLAYASEYQCITTINLKCGTSTVDHTGGHSRPSCPTMRGFL